MSVSAKRWQKSFQNFFDTHSNQSQGIFAGFPDSYGGGRGGGGSTPTTGGDLPPYDPNAGTGTDATKQYWTFPQYSQTWAFTPPAPSPYFNPQPFDPKKYGNPLNTKSVKKNV